MSSCVLEKVILKSIIMISEVTVSYKQKHLTCHNILCDHNYICSIFLAGNIRRIVLKKKRGSIKFAWTKIIVVCQNYDGHNDRCDRCSYIES